MKGLKITIENQIEVREPIYLYRSIDVIDAIAHAIYYTANPDTKMCIPNCAYEKAEKMFEEWKNETREKKEIRMYRTCNTCEHKEMKGSVQCDVCSDSLTAINYKEKKC